MRLTQKHLSPVGKKTCWLSVRSSTCRSPGEQARMSAATLIPRHQATNPVTLPWIRGQKPHTPPKARHWRTHHPAPADLAVGDIASMPSIWSTFSPCPLQPSCRGTQLDPMESSCFTTWMTSCWLARQARTPVPRRCPGCCWCVTC